MLKPVWILLGVFLAPLAHAALPFATATVEYREVDQTYAAEALVEAVKQSTVAAQISGRIVEVHFDVGDTVQKGQVLVRIDESEARQAVAGSEAVVAQARANLQNARRTMSAPSNCWRRNSSARPLWTRRRRTTRRPRRSWRRPRRAPGRPPPPGASLP